MSGTPKSDASYPKLKALRQSGYTGPVDQDGNKVTTGLAAGILKALKK
jgi:hypothetical protein